MADGRSTIIDFVEKYTAKYSGKTFLREKSGGVWTETSFKKTRDESRILAAGFMALGLRKGDKVALLSEGRKLWVMAELGILYAGGVQSGLQSSKFVVASAAALPALREELEPLECVRHNTPFPTPVCPGRRHPSVYVWPYHKKRAGDIVTHP